MSEENKQEEQPVNEREGPSIAETWLDAEQPITHNLSTEALAEVDLQPSNPDMEVHHHAHDPAAPHHKKNWKSYFWEFLMLFLAVFCGFLAEYQQEHKIEKEREKHYMQSLIADLKNDQPILIKHTIHAITGIDMMNSVINILNAPLLIAYNTVSCITWQDWRNGLNPYLQIQELLNS